MSTTNADEPCRGTRRRLLAPVAAVALAAVCVTAPARVSADGEVVVFTYTGGVQTWRVPADVYRATFNLGGGPGGVSYSGVPAARGASVVATIDVIPGETLQIRVGGAGGATRYSSNLDDESAGRGGWNGGGDGGEQSSGGDIPFKAPGGGGATDVRRDPSGRYGLSTRILVAGGGGGHSFFRNHASDPVGGLGGAGGRSGAAGVSGPGGGAGGCENAGGPVMPVLPGQGVGAGAGGGGTSRTGGTGGTAGDATGVTGSNTSGSPGVAGRGGDGGDAFGCGGLNDDAGGGGGGGYFGGGGGGGATVSNGGGGGGGGSSFAPTGATITAGTSTGGRVAISYTPDPGGGSARPDASARQGTRGAFVGDDVYSVDPDRQSLTARARRGDTITYQVRLENDGNARGRLTLRASGTSRRGYVVRYLHGRDDITAAVVAGTWRTRALDPGSSTVVVVRIDVTDRAARRSSVSRNLTAGLPSGSASDRIRLTVARR